MSEAYIYALCDPNTGERCYVGQSIHPELRLYQHLNQTDCLSRRASWINELLAHGKEPKMELLEVVTNERERRGKELFWIRKCLQDGCHLVNSDSDLREANRRQYERLSPFCCPFEYAKKQKQPPKQRWPIMQKTVFSNLSTAELAAIDLRILSFAL